LEEEEFTKDEVVYGGFIVDDDEEEKVQDDDWVEVTIDTNTQVSANNLFDASIFSPSPIQVTGCA
jgi:hypothetical protein